MRKTFSMCIMVSSLIFMCTGLVCAEKNINSSIQTETLDRCAIIPKEDNCKGYFHIYYFDTHVGKCQEIRGCYDTVFNSMEECRKFCEKNTDAGPLEVSSSKALLQYLNEGNGDPGEVKRLIEQGADVNYSDPQYRLTPLHNVSHHGHFEAARVLLDHGARVDAKNLEGNTPLYAAVHQQHIKIANMLLEKGADVNAKNKFGYAPLRAASRAGNIEIIQLLIEKGAQVNTRDNKRNMPLHFAIVSGHVQAVRILVDAGADVNAAGNSDDTPLHSASGKGHLEIVKLLLDKGGNLSARESLGRTPLHVASLNGATEIVKLLLEKGADVNAKDDDGKTALDLARVYFAITRETETVEFLMRFMEEQKKKTRL